MPLFVQSQRVSLNQTQSFSFPGAIRPGYYAVGGSMFGLYYPNLEAHNVRSLSMSLTHGQQDERTIFVTVNGSLQDDNGHSADPRSGCYVVVMAWVGTSDTPTLNMQNLTGVSSSYSPKLQMPPNATLVATFLSGLRVELQAEQGVTSFSASSGANVDTIDGTVTITGGSMLNGTEGTVDVGLLMVTDSKAPFQVFTKSLPSDGNFYPLDFNPAVAAAVTPLVSFGGQFCGEPVVLMCADSSFLDPTFPSSSIQVMWSVNIVNHDSGTQAGSINALAVGLDNGSLSGALLRNHKS